VTRKMNVSNTDVRSLHRTGPVSCPSSQTSEFGCHDQTFDTQKTCVLKVYFPDVSVNRTATLVTGLDVDLTYMDVGKGREQER